MKNKPKTQNFLDLVFVHNENFRAELQNDGRVTVFVENKGLCFFIAQKLFKKPRFSQIHLEEFGSFIWQQIDGKNTVEQIAALVKTKFGAQAEPLYPRLVQYMRMLLNYGFIVKA